MDSETQALSGDAALRLVADRWRRRTLESLIEQDDGVTTVQELARSVASRAPGGDETGDGEVTPT